MGCPQLEAVDWYLITRAWLCGALLAFDPVVRMDYRQHGTNLARFRPPFTSDRVRADTDLVRRHFQQMLAGLPRGRCPTGSPKWAGGSRHRSIPPAYRLHKRQLGRYVRALNAWPSPLPVVVVRRSPIPATPVDDPEGANMRTVTLGNVTVGEGNPPYIIAEVGSNHNGDMDLCRQLIDAAAEAGAHAVKFQSWSESSLIAEEEYDRNPEYSDKKKHFGSLREMVRAYQFTPDQHREAAPTAGRAASRSARAPSPRGGGPA